MMRRWCAVPLSSGVSRDLFVAAAFVTCVLACGAPMHSANAQSAAVPEVSAKGTPVVKPRTQPVRPIATSVALSPAQLSLDDWVIRRFRGAELMPDSGGNAPSLGTHTGAPRVDGTRTADHRDTVVALHFDTTFFKASLASAANVRFADESGEVSGIGGRITARRAFRAPRKPNAVEGNPADWRIGWAYLVAVPLKTANAVTSGLNGWALIEAPSPNTKRANN